MPATMTAAPASASDSKVRIQNGEQERKGSSAHLRQNREASRNQDDAGEQRENIVAMNLRWHRLQRIDEVAVVESKDAQRGDRGPIDGPAEQQERRGEVSARTHSAVNSTP